MESTIDSPEDLSSITTNVDNHSLSMGSVDSDNQCESWEKQIQDLTKQLNESQSMAKYAQDERDKYVDMYHRLNERFLAFERKQLDQMRRVLTYLTSDQQKLLPDQPEDYQRTRRAFTSPSTSMLLPSAYDASPETTEIKSEINHDELLAQMAELMELSEKLAMKCAEQTDENHKLRLINNQKHEENTKLIVDLSLSKADFEKEQELRTQFEQQLNDAQKIIEQDRSKRLLKLRNYATLADDEGDILLSSLMKKAEKNDLDFREMKLQYENVFLEQVNQIKKFIKERELLHLRIQRLEVENASLAAMTNDNETIRLLTRSSQSPTSLEEATELIAKLREEIVQQLKLRDKLKHDLAQSEHNYQMDLREREQIEELLNRDITTAKDQILLLQSVQTEYEHLLIVKSDLEKQLEQCQMKFATAKSRANTLKEKVEEVGREKEKLDEDNISLRLQVQKLRLDFENSESVQHDFVKLSQSLQMQLEEIRNSGNELRWQPEEDFNECQRCQSPFTMTMRKHHCRHCGKVMCRDCTNKIVTTGPNHRQSRVCDVCYTLLVKSSQPYFLSGVPKV